MMTSEIVWTEVVLPDQRKMYTAEMGCMMLRVYDWKNGKVQWRIGSGPNSTLLKSGYAMSTETAKHIAEITANGLFARG